MSRILRGILGLNGGVIDRQNCIVTGLWFVLLNVYCEYCNIEKNNGGWGHVAGKMLNKAVKKLKERNYFGNPVVDGILK
jgi:hypothetical protein